jgi:hypothetical protein
MADDMAASLDVGLATVLNSPNLAHQTLKPEP